MEGTEEQQHSSSSPQTNGENLQPPPPPPPPPQQQLGLGFQPPVSPKPPDPNHLDPPPNVVQELRTLSLKESNEGVYSLALEQAVTLEERELKQAIDEENHQLALKQAINEAVHDESSNQEIDEPIAAKNTEANIEEIDHREDNKAKNESETKKFPVLKEENEVNQNGEGSNEAKDIELKEGIIDNYENKWREIENDNENEKGNDDSNVKQKQGINNYENNWSESENWDVNARIKVKEGQGSDNYEDERSENEGYNEYENVEGDSVAGLKDGKYRRCHYPLRPDAEDCSYYMRTGTCKFGSNCKFNHPLRRRNQASKETFKQKEEYSDRLGQTECKYYLTSGGCKYGKACRYNHGRGKTAVAPIPEYNFLGLPNRPGEKECPYYMRNGSCKYGSNCRFNHPDPKAVGGGFPLSGSGYGDASVQGGLKDTISGWSSARTMNETAPFVPIMYPPSPGVSSPNPEWNGYQAPLYPTSERSLPTPPAFAMNIPVTDTNFYTHHQQQMLVEEFPERPGQPECSYFMKTGDCKYRSGCKFHHPKNWNPNTSSFVLSDKGLPLRPDQNICTHYSRYGICKFGPSCKYDHPVNCGNSASSAGSGPGQPPLYGNSAIADGEWKRESLMQQSV